MQSIKIGLVIVLIILIIVIYRKIVPVNYKIIHEPVHDAKIDKKINSNKMILSTPYKGLGFSTSLWIYIKDWNYKFGKRKYVLKKGGLNIYFGKRDNTVNLSINTYNNTKPNKIVFHNLPIQKWIHICIILNNRNLDLWLNGKLYGSKLLPNLPKLYEEKDLFLCYDGGFSGYISRIYHYLYPINQNDVKQIYKWGPIKKSIFGEGEANFSLKFSTKIFSGIFVDSE